MDSVSRVFRNFGLLLLSLALFQVTLGPAPVLKVVAWGQMAVTYSAESGWLKGLIQTVDGRHPCQLCDRVDGHSAPTQPDDMPTPQEREAVAKSFLAPLAGCSMVNASADSAWRWGRVASQSAHARSVSPETPPPRDSA